MLRNLLGDDIWSGTRNYIETYANDVVETDDLRRVASLWHLSCTF